MKPFKLTKHNWNSSFLLLAIFFCQAALFNAHSSHAETTIDLRAETFLSEEKDVVYYAASVENCSQVVSIATNAGELSQNISISDVERVSESSTGCGFIFPGAGVGRFEPEIIVRFADGTSQTYSEQFSIEHNQPDLTFESTNLFEANNRQKLSVTVSAADDIDISYIAFNVIGIRASDLRAFGGVISKVKDKAFAATKGNINVYPQQDNQGQYTLTLDLTSALTQEEIAHEGIVIADITAIDASGNQTTISKISFTGKDVEEQVSNLIVAPEKIIFTNLLESVPLSPSVDFQFRGRVDMGGYFNKVSYTSSDTSIVQVTQEGIVYPVSESSEGTAFITVSYPGLTPVNVPVEINLQRSIVSLKAQGLDASGYLSLDSLNAPYALPTIIAVFDDASDVEITDQTKIQWSMDENFNGIVNLYDNKTIISRAIIERTSPATLTAMLNADVALDIPVIAEDGLPEVEIRSDSQAKSGGQIMVSATADDDVGVSEVQFYFNGTYIGARKSPPYDLTVQIPEEYANETISFQAKAIDSAGKSVLSNVMEVRVLKIAEDELPDISIDYPESLQRYVEGSTIQYQVSCMIGDTYHTNISYVEFYLDGKYIGRSNFPMYEERDVEGGEYSIQKRLFAYWRLNSSVPFISTSESSRAIYAVAHGAGGNSVQSESLIYRIIGNTAPAVKILSPAEENGLSVGQTLQIVTEVTDDTLPLGVELNLLINGVNTDSYYYENKDAANDGAFTVKKTTHTFYYPINEELIGSRVSIQVQATDFHTKISQSQLLNLPVGNDRSPSVSISSPGKDTQLVSGEIVDIRAEASDDLEVKRVDFFVQERLVGSDDTAPYRFSYQTPPGIETPQILTISAISFDSAGQKSETSEIQVTLIKDNKPPIINMVSPRISAVDPGMQAEVTENSNIVLKVTGYDNVKIGRLELAGVAFENGAYRLTGDTVNDIIGGSAFQPQSLPGSANAFSAFKIVHVPPIIENDHYTVHIKAIDEAGNAAVIDVEIVVMTDKAPCITSAKTDKSVYYRSDSVNFNVIAKDDISVGSLISACYIDGSETPAFSQTIDITPAQNAQINFSIDLKTLGLTNQAHTLDVELIAVDQRGRQSDSNTGEFACEKNPDDTGKPYRVPLTIQEDSNGPAISVEKPIKGSSLHYGDTIQISVAAMDDSGVSKLELSSEGIVIKTINSTKTAVECRFDYVLPRAGTAFNLLVSSIDLENNPSSVTHTYPLTEAAKPELSVKSPPGGSRFIEGEQFTFHILVGGERPVDKVEIFYQGDNTPLKTFSARDISSAQEANTYLSYAATVPGCTGGECQGTGLDNKQQSLMYTIRATNDLGGVAEIPHEIFISSDSESPAVILTDPATEFSAMPETKFKVTGTADDNFNIDAITPVLEINSHLVILSWTSFTRQDRTETIRIANPNSFGTAVVSSHFYTDFSGYVTLPATYLNETSTLKSLIDHAGETIKLKIKARDYGGNDAYSNSTGIIIKRDDKKPSIHIMNLEDRVVENQPVSASIIISDNIAVDDYKVYIDGTPSPTILSEETGVNQAVVTLDNIVIDISGYDPLVDTNNSFVLVVEASDTNGNMTRASQIVTVQVNTPPQFEIINLYPERELTKGGLAYQSIYVTDDYASPDDPFFYFPVFTSLGGLEADKRNPTGSALLEGGSVRPYIRLDYPENTSQTGEILLGGKTYISGTAPGTLDIFPMPDLDNLSTPYLKVDFGAGISVVYHVTVYHDDGCIPLPQLHEINAPEGINLETIVDLTGGSTVNHALITLDAFNSQNAPIDRFIEGIRIDWGNLKNVTGYKIGQSIINVQNDTPIITVFIKDKTENNSAFVTSHRLFRQTENTGNPVGLGIPVPAIHGIDAFDILIHGADNMSLTRTPPAHPISILSSRHISDDPMPPQLSITAPTNGMRIAPLMTFPVEIKVTDNSKGISSIKLYENNDHLIYEKAGSYKTDTYKIPYTMPTYYNGAALDLRVVVEDPAGTTASQTLSLPVVKNEPPVVTLIRFSSYFDSDNEKYLKNIVTPERLNTGEFQVRANEQFDVAFSLSDDTGLADCYIYRLQGGVSVEPYLYHKDFGTACPETPVTHVKETPATLMFSDNEPVEYEVAVTDNHGVESSRRFLVRPVDNMAPEIRVVYPSADQRIVSGAFRIAVGIAVTDDRILSENNINVYVNDQLLVGRIDDDAKTLDDVKDRQDVGDAFNSIHDHIEEAYPSDQNALSNMADEYGTINSPYAAFKEFVLDVPASIAGQSANMKIKAVITDSEKAIGEDTVAFTAEPDTIMPEISIMSPSDQSYGATEFSDFNLKFRAYDNVKVEELMVYLAYGMTVPGENYRKLPYDAAPIRKITAIQAKDFDPVSTINIDTPAFDQLIHVKQLSEIITHITDAFSNVVISKDCSYDLWIKITAKDRSGLTNTIERIIPVLTDTKPFVDIVSPLNNSKVVAGSRVVVNINSYDDVGINQVRLTADHAGSEIYNTGVNAPPYQFVLTIPPYDSVTATNNTLRISVEAIDSYGSVHADATSHKVIETIDLTIIEDHPPTIAIAKPEANGPPMTEGQYLVVEINAVDDVGIAMVNLSVSGLITGDKTLTDTAFPYEFLIKIPYGQDGKPISLSAGATETRLSGNARSVTTTRPTVVSVVADDIPPEITILRPSAGVSTVVEKRTLKYAAQVWDNVGVTSVTVTLLADSNNSHTFEDSPGQTMDKLLAEHVMLAPPYSGTISLGTIANCLNEDVTADTVNLRLRFTAVDGAGKAAESDIELTLIPNSPPEISQIQILDSRGFSLGNSISELTEGRSIVVNVVASDAESGVDKVRLDHKIGGSDFQLIDEDEAAPYQFHFTVPAGHVGEVLQFQAQAFDTDNYASELYTSREILIKEDLPPTVTITKPSANEYAIVKGQDIEVLAEAIDDLGSTGIDRVIFYINDIPVQTVYDSYAKQTGSAARENTYRAVITPPQGVKGFILYVAAYDILGHRTQSRPVLVGQVDDTVLPKLTILYPAPGEILTASKPVNVFATVEDIGSESARQVTTTFIREYLENSGEWVELASYSMDLDTVGDHPADTPFTDTDNHLYVSWGSYTDSDLFARTGEDRERLRIVSTCGPVVWETIHEIGYPVAEQHFFLPSEPPLKGLEETEILQAQSIYHTSLTATNGNHQGAVVAAWSTQDPMRLESGLNHLTIPEFQPEFSPVTGIYLVDQVNVFSYTQGDGRFYAYNADQAGTYEMFKGTITELAADAHIVLASKTGQLMAEDNQGTDNGFADAMKSSIQAGTEPDGIHLENVNGEMLVFAVSESQGLNTFPYRLAGRIDMPYPTVFGLAMKDALAFVANGNGGLQVINIGNLNAPYHVGYIKPNGFVRDVVIYDHFAVMAASHQGIVIADLSSPAMPIISSLDTLGVANRLFIEGTDVYVADMAGDGNTSQLNIIDISDPYAPRLVKTVPLRPSQTDLVPDGSYDVTVSGGKAFVTVHYSDQEDNPAQSVVEIIDLGRLNDQNQDTTVPVVIHSESRANMLHRNTSEVDFAPRGLLMANGVLNVAGSKQGVIQIESPDLSISSHLPSLGEEGVSPELDYLEPDNAYNGHIVITFSKYIKDYDTMSPEEISSYIQVSKTDPELWTGLEQNTDFSEDIGPSLFNYQFYVDPVTGQPQGNRIAMTLQPGVLLDPDAQYFITVKKGLMPITGQALKTDYTFDFLTAESLTAQKPAIFGVSPDRGSIDGNTLIMVFGVNFGLNPALYLGGQRLVIDDVIPKGVADGEGTTDPDYDRIYARTVPNYPGPATLRIVGDNQMEDTAIGAFTYLDELEISHIVPAIVKVAQTGDKDQVEIVGYGFNDTITIKAWKSGDPSTETISTTADGDITLYSSERLIWTVPGFGGSYRGFVDIDISNGSGSRCLMPNAIFYGLLQVDDQIETETFISKEDADRFNSGDSQYIKDPGKLDPGYITDLLIDSDMDKVYVLGTGYIAPCESGCNTLTPNSVKSAADVDDYFAPGWIDILDYQLTESEFSAAPSVGLGYYNLPKDLTPRAMVFSETHLYVTGKGYHFPYINRVRLFCK